MRLPVNDQQTTEQAEYTVDEIFNHFELLISMPEFDAPFAEQLQVARRHFSLLIWARLPANLREQLGTDPIYTPYHNYIGRQLINDSERVLNIMQICIPTTRIRSMENVEDIDIEALD